MLRAFQRWWGKASRRQRWLVRALALPVGIYLLYLIAMNGLLMSGGLATFINGRQDDVRITSSKAWTFWFGRVHVRHILIVVQESDVEVMVWFPRATATLRPFNLASLDFRLGEVRGEQGSLVIRRRVPKTDATEHRMKGLPEIVGLPPPIIDEPVAPDTDFSNNWTLHFEDIDVGLHSVWVDNFRLVGQLRVTGGYRWATAQWLRFDDVRLNIVEAELAIAGRAAATIGGEVSLNTGKLSQSPPVALSELLAVSRIEACLSAESVDPAAFDWLIESRKVSFAGGDARVEIEGALHEGTLELGTRVDVALRSCAVQTGEWRVTSTGSVRLNAEGRGTSAAIDIEAALSQGKQAPLAQLVPARVALQWGDRKVATLVKPPAVGIVAKAEVFDLRRVAVALGSRDPVIEGAIYGKLEGQLDTNGSGKSSVDLRGEAITVRWRKRGYRCDVVAQTQFRHAAPTQGEGSGAMKIDRCVFADEGAWKRTPWSADLDLWRLAFDGKRSLTVAARGRAPDADPIFEVPELDEAVPDVPLAFVDLENLKFDAALFKRDDVLEIEIYEASTDGMSVRGRLLAGHDYKSGAFLVDVPLVTLGVDVTSQGADVTLYPDDGFGKAHFDELRRD